MTEEELKIKDEVKEQPEEVIQPEADINPDVADSTEAKPEASGETLTPSETPSMNSEPEPTEEQVEAAEPESVDQIGVQSEPSEAAEEQVEKMLSQSQVNDLIGRTRTEAREKALREIYERYGVSSDDELNDVFGRGQAYDVLNDSYANQGNQLKDIMAENALLKSGISQSRWGDARAILNAKGLEITQENIISELATHPEWSGASTQNGSGATQPLTPEMAEKLNPNGNIGEKEMPSTIRRLGSEAQPKVADDEESQMNKLFGFNR